MSAFRCYYELRKQIHDPSIMQTTSLCIRWWNQTCICLIQKTGRYKIFFQWRLHDTASNLDPSPHHLQRCVRWLYATGTQFYDRMKDKMKKRELLAKYLGCSIVISAKVGNSEENRYCITDVKYAGHTITDHLRIAGWTPKGKWDPIFMEIIIGEYERADWSKDYGVKRYKHIPISVMMWRNEHKRRVTSRNGRKRARRRERSIW